jgi:DNA repair exonuclease SbcCD ATPase subunit
MKRGFEENVPKVRPRVRLGRALDEQLSEAQDLAAQESAGPPIAPALETQPPEPSSEPEQLTDAASHGPLAPAPVEMPPRLPEPARVLPRMEEARARREEPARLAEARERAQAAAQPVEATPLRPRRSTAAAAAAEVTELARELTSELTRAGDENARLKTDLDAALTALRTAADESREQREETRRLSAEVEKRAGAARDLLGELELLEAERDGALAQSARMSRELREEKARAAQSVSTAEEARREATQARESLQRLAADLQARAAERDEARKELLTVRADRDRIAEELLAAAEQVDEAAQSRSALEEIHRALAEARTRVGPR